VSAPDLLLLLATRSPSPSPSGPAVDPDRVTPGYLGFLAVLFMAGAVVLLIRSMNKQMKKVDFDEAATDRKKPKPAPVDDAVPTDVPPADAPEAR
jgi:hypothetical protein